jgi:MYXO-CTERM domain-containing protein
MSVFAILAASHPATAQDDGGIDDADATGDSGGCDPETCAAACTGHESQCLGDLCACMENLYCPDVTCPDNGRCTCALAGPLPAGSWRSLPFTLAVLGLLWLRRGRRPTTRAREGRVRRPSGMTPFLLASVVFAAPIEARAQDMGGEADAVDVDDLDDGGAEADSPAEADSQDGSLPDAENDAPLEADDPDGATCDEVCPAACQRAGMWGGGYCVDGLCHCPDHIECPDREPCRTPVCCSVAATGADDSLPGPLSLLSAALLLRRARRRMRLRNEQRVVPSPPR